MIAVVAFTCKNGVCLHQRDKRKNRFYFVAQTVLLLQYGLPSFDSLVLPRLQKHTRFKR